MRRLLLSTLTCCFALACVNVLDDVESPSDGPAVFGRIVVEEGAKSFTGADFRSDPIRLIVLPGGSQTGFTYQAHGDGFFCWALPPGDYSVAAWTRGTGRNLTSGRIGARFSVPKVAEPTYIGTLAIRFERGAYQTRVDDQRTDVGCGGQIADATTQLMTRDPEPGSFRETLPICDAFWGIDCDSRNAGVVPTSPRASTSFPRPSGVTPRLMWESVGDGRFTYDVVVYEAAHWTETGVDPQYFPGRVALYEENLAQPSLALATVTPLARDSRFYWTVRLRDGERVSTWSTYGFVAVIPLIGFQWGSNRWFTFSTP